MHSNRKVFSYITIAKIDDHNMFDKERNIHDNNQVATRFFSIWMQFDKNDYLAPLMCVLEKH